MIDIMLLAVLAIVTYLVAAEGAWGAGITFVSVIISGLLAMNFYEPVAAFLSQNLLTSPDWQVRIDIIAMLGLFSLGVFGLRILSEQLLPTYVPVNGLTYDGARWGFGFLTGYATVAILLTSLHVSPLPREFVGFSPEHRAFFGISPDHQWLGFTQYVSEKSLRRRDPQGQPVIFDGAVFPANPNHHHTSQVWSSFPIKYAARREQFYTGQVSSSPVQLSPAPAAPAGRPRPGAGTGGF